MIPVSSLLLLSLLSVHGQGRELRQLRETILQNQNEFPANNGSGTFSEEVTESSSSEDEVEFTEFQLEALKVHNLYRAQHGVPPLELSKEICSDSQEWADKLLAEDNLQHSQNSKYGENLYSGGNPIQAVESWYDEGKDYTFGQEPSDWSSAGHFTQVVWKTSTKIGRASCRERV